MRRAACLALLGVTLAGWTPAQAPADVSLKVIKYAELGDVIRSHKGKVVVVDFWADFCIPCKREMPHLVELHQKYAAQGLVALTVATDDPRNEKVKASLLKFLTAQKATMTNLIIEEPLEEWAPKVGLAKVPCVFVFNRAGKYRRFDAERIEEGYGNIALQVAEFLKEK